MQRACSEDGFLQEARVGIRSWSEAAVRQRALVVERFVQMGAFLKGCLHEAVKGVQDGEALAARWQPRSQPELACVLPARGLGGPDQRLLRARPRTGLISSGWLMPLRTSCARSGTAARA